MAHFESEGGIVPMLCPGCCTIDDIPDWLKHNADDGKLTIVVGCHRCGFAFPVLPGEFKSLTLEAMHNHDCQGPQAGNWKAVGEVIIARIGELDGKELATFMEAARQQPEDDD